MIIIKRKTLSSLQLNIFGSKQVCGRHISCLFYLTRVDKSEKQKEHVLYLSGNAI
jgi:hypothetical protein